MLTHLAFFFIFIMLNAYQISFIKAYGKFQYALSIRVLGIAFFLFSFYTIYYFSQNEIAVILALAFSYVGMFLVSLFIENRLLKDLVRKNKRESESSSE
jgi:O-antigen/teichoic acid export membrane protein